MKIIEYPISLDEIKEIAKETFGTFVKAVVDVEKKIMAIGGELHSDEEELLITEGSKQQNLWGINLCVELDKENWIEFDSIINIRPSVNNFSRYVESEEIRRKIVDIVNNFVLR